MVFAAENRRLYGGFGGRKFPIAGIKKFPNVPEIKIERSKIKKRTFDFSETNAQKKISAGL